MTGVGHCEGTRWRNSVRISMFIASEVRDCANSVRSSMFIANKVRDCAISVRSSMCRVISPTHFTPKGVSLPGRPRFYKHATTTWLDRFLKERLGSHRRQHDKPPRRPRFYRHATTTWLFELGSEFRAQTSADNSRTSVGSAKRE